MSPAEASEILNDLVEEPDWIALWAILNVADDGYDTILDRWRKWHFIPIWIDGVQKKRLGSSADGMIALAKLGIMARLIPENPLTNLVDQIDDHCWLITEGRAWRILGIEDNMLMLNSFGEEKQIDLSRAKWDKYCEAHAAVLDAQQKAPGAHAMNAEGPEGGSEPNAPKPYLVT